MWFDSATAVGAFAHFDLKSTKDSSVLFLRRDDMGDTYLVYNEKIRKFTYYNDFLADYPPRSKSDSIINSYWLNGSIIDSTQILLYLAVHNEGEYANSAFYIYDATKDSLRSIPKIWFPEANDSANLSIYGHKTWLSKRRLDTLVPSPDGYYYARILSYEYSKALDALYAGDSSAADIEPSYSLMQYDPNKRECKVVVSSMGVFRNKIIDEYVNKPRNTLWTDRGPCLDGYYWLVDGYAEQSTNWRDTLFIYDSKNDSLIVNPLSEYFSFPSEFVRYTNYSDNGMIMMLSNRNNIYVRHTDGRMVQNVSFLRCFVEVIDSTTNIELISDYDENVYILIDSSRTFLRLTPEGELNEFTFGPELGAEQHLSALFIIKHDKYSQSKIFEYEKNKYLFTLARRISSDTVGGINLTSIQYVAFDLHYYDGISGVPLGQFKVSPHIRNVYPNPITAGSGKSVNFEISDVDGVVPPTVEVFNSLGEKVINSSYSQIAFSGIGGNYSVSCDVSGLPTGVYFVYVYGNGSGGMRSCRRFVIE